MTEIWKDVVGYEGLYLINQNGVIKSLDRYKDNLLTGGKSIIKGKIRKTYICEDGYEMVVLSKDGVNKTFSVHRLVAKAFIPNPSNLPTVDHINRNKTDNRVENLRWVDYSTQLRNREVDYSKRNRQYSIGGEHCRAKPVVCVETGEWFACIKDAANKFELNASNLGYVCRGLRDTCGGYHWRYVE